MFTLHTGKPSLDETEWEFYPNAAVWNNVCSRRSAALTWEDKPGIRRVTTGQLIVQEDYMIQFKVFSFQCIYRIKRENKLHCLISGFVS